MGLGLQLSGKGYDVVQGGSLQPKAASAEDGLPFQPWGNAPFSPEKVLENAEGIQDNKPKVFLRLGSL